MRKFDYNNKCLKCGFAEKSVFYHRGSEQCMYEAFKFGGEHLHIKCGICGFEWAELPLNVEELCKKQKN